MNLSKCWLRKAHGTPLANTSILLVDNDDLLLQDVADMLVQAGAEVASCINPSDALEAITLAPREWDMVLTDFDMDGMTAASWPKQCIDSAKTCRSS